MTDYYYELAHGEMDKLVLFNERQDYLLKIINNELNKNEKSRYRTVLLSLYDLQVIKDALERNK